MVQPRPSCQQRDHLAHLNASTCFLSDADILPDNDRMLIVDADAHRITWLHCCGCIAAAASLWLHCRGCVAVAETALLWLDGYSGLARAAPLWLHCCGYVAVATLLWLHCYGCMFNRGHHAATVPPCPVTTQPRDWIP